MMDSRSFAAGSPSTLRSSDSAGAPLAHRQDFPLGAAFIRPAIRTVDGPGGSVTVEPRVMQVLLALVDARGAVLTRDDLLRICWNGAVVGDDAINRAIAEVRRIARTTEAGFGVETIPRVGYRLTGASFATPAVADPMEPVVAIPPPTVPGPSRRWLLGGAVALAAASGLGLWATFTTREDPRFRAAMERGMAALRGELPGAKAQGAEHFRAATEIDPAAADAWGLLALTGFLSAAYLPPREAGAVVSASAEAARRAIALESGEPNARTALALMERGLDDWSTTEKKLQVVLAHSPQSLAPLDSLVALFQAAGFVHDSWVLNERSLAIDPLRPGPQQRRALKHWIMGRPKDANQVITRAVELWPSHPFVWNARLLVSAFTGQFKAARLQIEVEASQPFWMTASGVAAWRASLAALESRAPTDIAAARVANLAAAPASPGLGVHAILVLSALNEVDAAYSIVDGLLLNRGELATLPRGEQSGSPEHNPAWRQTQWLFTPATKPLREHSRFAALCDEIGLSDYWAKRGIGPDERRS